MNAHVVRAMPWPAPAIAAWAAGWAVAAGLRQAGLPAAWPLLLGAVVATAVAAGNVGWRRRAIAAAGFPLSAALMLPGTGLPPLLWPALLVPLVALYPLRAWRDAPFFPTPAAALQGLERVVLPGPRRALDAGCGLGHGLAALQRLWPAAELHGAERSAPLAWLAARRLRAARVRRADMWALSWAGFDLVYLFQRPESMARAWAKAVREMEEGSWLVSLEFPVPDVPPTAQLHAGTGRAVFVYRIRRARGGTEPHRSSRSTAAPAGR
ncbi:MAG: class I SAM-dependent methyltransferase [Rubrivivax sp.]|nr:class I SAM-dependent methyltransferase [Rubrivivax sp.]